MTPDLATEFLWDLVSGSSTSCGKSTKSQPDSVQDGAPSLEVGNDEARDISSSVAEASARLQEAGQLTTLEEAYKTRQRNLQYAAAMPGGRLAPTHCGERPSFMLRRSRRN